MKKVIITGINGQLGQFMAKYIIDTQPDLQVIGTIRHKSYDEQPYIFDRSKVTIELMDLSDPHSIESLIVKYRPDYFINTAANAFVGESWQVPAQHFEINALAVLHQLEAIRKHSSHTRYFNMGTSEEFGATKEGRLNESSLLLPRSPYGASKVAARQIVRVWRESYGLYAIQGWTFNFESELRGEKYVTRKIAKGVARIARALKDGKPFEPIELGNVDSYRSWQFAGDVADGIWRMLNQETYNRTLNQQAKSAWKVAQSYESPKKTFNDWLVSSLGEYVLSAPDVHTVRQFVEASFRQAGITGLWRGSGVDETFDSAFTGFDPKMANHPSDEEMDRFGLPLVRINPVFYRPADVTYLHGDATAITSDLGWTPTLSFDNLVSRMVGAELKAQGLS